MKPIREKIKINLLMQAEEEVGSIKRKGRNVCSDEKETRNE